MSTVDVAGEAGPRSAAGRPDKALLTVEGAYASYDRGAVHALNGLNLEVRQGEIVVLLGANGMGKTTTLRAITGLLGRHGGQLSAGKIIYDGTEISHSAPARGVHLGISQVMEGRRVFSDMTVDDNLRAGAFGNSDRARFSANYERVMTLFPRLTERRRILAGLLSGGEQQMLAIGRALMQNPTLLLLDEPSLGLAPLIVAQIRDIIAEVNAEGASVLLIEQNAAMALSIAHYGYVLEHGRVAREGSGTELLADGGIRDLYLGLGDGSRASVRAQFEQNRAARG